MYRIIFQLQIMIRPKEILIYLQAILKIMPFQFSVHIQNDGHIYYQIILSSLLYMLQIF